MKSPKTEIEVDMCILFINSRRSVLLWCCGAVVLFHVRAISKIQNRKLKIELYAMKVGEGWVGVGWRLSARAGKLTRTDSCPRPIF